MEAYFNANGQLLYVNGKHKTYSIIWGKIDSQCKKWSRNRDADMNRVDEMDTFQGRGGYIPRMIHLAVLEDEGLVCYDGNHRRELFRRGSLLYDIRCIVDVIFGATQRDVYEAFNHINKSVQVPELYFEESDGGATPCVKDEIVALARSYEKRYKPFLSTSAYCHRPNFNRDGFVNNIYDIYLGLDKKLGVSQIAVALEVLNEKYGADQLCKKHARYPKGVIDKCAQHGLWLFLERTVPLEHVKQCLT
jgi:hypothetical protein